VVWLGADWYLAPDRCALVGRPAPHAGGLGLDVADGLVAYCVVLNAGAEAQVQVFPLVEGSCSDEPCPLVVFNQVRPCHVRRFRLTVKQLGQVHLSGVSVFVRSLG
jgi:hypothetical protein